ncbi:YigZ family protein [bacterium]|nr:YigZ family protein [Chitinophagia bacterium]NDB62023.1 YigZ family protein [bacterium]
MFYYNTISQTAIAEFKDRGSKFIAYSFPVTSIDACKKILAQLKKEHPKAVHHCLAYRIGVDGSTYRVSDDGEPSGSAGRPILGQIDSKQLTNIMVVVVRYFGGTLLGVPGLINAYKTATSLALQLAPIIQKSVEIEYVLNFDYQQMNEVMMVVKQYQCTVLEQSASLFVMLKIGVPKARLEEVISKWKDLQGITYTPL